MAPPARSRRDVLKLRGLHERLAAAGAYEPLYWMSGLGILVVALWKSLSLSSLLDVLHPVCSCHFLFQLLPRSFYGFTYLPRAQITPFWDANETQEASLPSSSVILGTI